MPRNSTNLAPKTPMKTKSQGNVNAAALPVNSASIDELEMMQVIENNDDESDDAASESSQNSVATADESVANSELAVVEGKPAISKLEAKELLLHWKALKGSSESRIAELAGYTKITNSGKGKIDLNGFRLALLAAKGVVFQDDASPVVTAPAIVTVQKNGAIVISAKHLSNYNLDYKTKFVLNYVKGTMTLVQV